MNLSEESMSFLMSGWVPDLTSGSLIVLTLLLVLPPARAADIEFLTEELPWAVLHKGYAPPPLESRSSGACPLGGVSYAVVSGALPQGLQLSRLGYLSGVPVEAGAFEIAVRVSNGCTWTAKHFVVTVAEAPVLSAEPQSLEFQCGRDQTNPLEEKMVRISSTWTRLGYQATSNVEWLTATPVKGFVLPAGDSLRVIANAKELKPGRYEAVVTVSAWQASQALRIAVVLTVTE